MAGLCIWELLMLISLAVFLEAMLLPTSCLELQEERGLSLQEINMLHVPVFGGGLCPQWSLATPSRGHSLPSLRRVHFQAWQGWEGAFPLLRGGFTEPSLLCINHCRNWI